MFGPVLEVILLSGILMEDPPVNSLVTAFQDETLFYPSMASVYTSCFSCPIALPDPQSSPFPCWLAPSFFSLWVSVEEVIKTDGQWGTSSSALALPSLATWVLFSPCMGSSHACLFSSKPELQTRSSGASVKNQLRDTVALALGQNMICLSASWFPFCYHQIMFAGWFSL